MGDDDILELTELIEENEALRGKKPKRDFICFFAFYVFTAVMAYIAAMTFIDVPTENVRVADLATGFMIGTALPMVINWAFRTSKSAMDEKQHKLTEKGK